MTPRYAINVFWSDEDKAWIARVPDLQGCTAHGETAAEAVKEIQIAIEGILEVMKEYGSSIPKVKYNPDPFQKEKAIKRKITKWKDSRLPEEIKRIQLSVLDEMKILIQKNHLELNKEGLLLSDQETLRFIEAHQQTIANNAIENISLTEEEEELFTLFNQYKLPPASRLKLIDVYLQKVLAKISSSNGRIKTKKTSQIT